MLISTYLLSVRKLTNRAMGMDKSSEKSKMVFKI